MRDRPEFLKLNYPQIEKKFHSISLSCINSLFSFKLCIVHSSCNPNYVIQTNVGFSPNKDGKWFPHSFNISKSIFHSCPQSMNALISPHLLLGEFFYIFSSCISFGSYFVFGTKKYIWKLLFFFSKVRICNNLCIFEIYT